MYITVRFSADHPNLLSSINEQKHLLELYLPSKYNYKLLPNNNKADICICTNKSEDICENEITIFIVPDVYEYIVLNKKD